MTTNELDDLLTAVLLAGARMKLNAAGMLAIHENRDLIPLDLRERVKAEHVPMASRLAEWWQEGLTPYHALIYLANEKRLPRHSGPVSLIDDQPIVLCAASSTRDLNAAVVQAAHECDLQTLRLCLIAWQAFEERLARAWVGNPPCIRFPNSTEQAGPQLPIDVKKEGNPPSQGLHPVRRWARDLFARGFLILDTETTGLLPDGEVVQIAVLGSDGRIVLNEYVKPQKPIDESGKAFAVHGITNAKVADSPSWYDLHPRLNAALYTQPVVIYNQGFDVSIMEGCCRRARLPLFQAEWHCAMLKYAELRGERVKGQFKWHKLAVACDHMGVDLTDAHDALGDCAGALALMRKIAE